jgi:pimeloyl-ACP methyl ester carboxylesterase
VTKDEPIPHWPGRLVSLGDHQVYVRSTPEVDNTGPDNTGPDNTEPDSTDLEYRGANDRANDRANDGANDRANDSAPAAPQPALFVHGLEGSSRNWTDLMDLLRPWLAGQALDLPGFGDSPPRPDRKYSIAALAQTVIRLIQASNHGPVHLIGNSLGGAVCVKVAATRPELIQSLTLVSPALPDPRPRMDLIRFPVMILPRLGPRLVKQYQVLPPERRVADVITTCYGDPALFPGARFATEVEALARRDELGYAGAVLIGSVRTLTAEFVRRGRHSAWRDAARVTAPTLVIYGSRDRLVDARMAGRAAHQFRDARIVVLPRTGHVAHMEHPALVAAEIEVLLGIPDPFRRLTQERAVERSSRSVR